jgi:hypothetical protein
MPNWFETAINDVGAATLVCSSPEGTIKGQAIVEVVPNRDPKISVEVAEFKGKDVYRGNLFMLLAGETPLEEPGGVVFSFGAGKANPGILRVETDKGVYRGSKIISYGGNFGRPIPDVIIPHVLDLTYRANGANPPKYYVLPLMGLKTNFFAVPELATHPLAVNQSRPAGLKFVIGDKPVFVQPLEAENGNTAAVLVAEVPEGEDDVQALTDKIPFEMLSALTFATGSRVSVPWVELRDAQGSVHSRMYKRVGHSTEKGGNVFLDFIHKGEGSGLEFFLSRFLALDESVRQWLQVAMNLCFSGTPGSSTVDDNLAYVFRAFELLMKNCISGRVDLKAQLSSKAAIDLETATTEFRQAVGAMRVSARSQGRMEDDRILERIQSRIATVHTADSDIGVLLTKLIQQAGFPDVEILDREYFPKTFNGKTWAKVVSELRQDTIHEGYLQFRKKHDIHVTFELLRHLHDLVARLILLASEYEGLYNPGVKRWHDAVPVRWVTSAMNHNILGFET